MRKGRHGLGVVIFIVSMVIFLYPDFAQWQLQKKSDQVLEQYREVSETQTESSKTEAPENEQQSSPQSGIDALESLYEELQAYNESLVLGEGQQPEDCWSYEQNPISLAHMPQNSDAIGKIRIPAMKVELPLYLGASADNLRAGAAVLAGTGMPIGGSSTNCVIAGHRGYGGLPFFRDIEKLKEGDSVWVENPWESMEYVVAGTSVVQPDDFTCLNIQGGQDLVTLLTCHPYMGHGKYRYVVYCVRRSEEEAAEEASGEPAVMPELPDTLADSEILQQEEVYSGRMVLLEKGLRGLLAVGFLLWWLLLICRHYRRRKS